MARAKGKALPCPDGEPICGGKRRSLIETGGEFVGTDWDLDTNAVIKGTEATKTYLGKPLVIICITAFALFCMSIPPHELAFDGKKLRDIKSGCENAH